MLQQRCRVIAAQFCSWVRPQWKEGAEKDCSLRIPLPGREPSAPHLALLTVISILYFSNAA